MEIYKEIKKLINYGISKQLIDERDKVCIINQILEILAMNEFFEVNTEEKIDCEEDLEDVLYNIRKYAKNQGIIREDGITSDDLFDTKIMGAITPVPSKIIDKFKEKYNVSAKLSTDYFYDISKSSNYIRMLRIKKDKKWKVETEYGELDITINLSKPEKDPKSIALEKNSTKGQYPKCLLCIENEGYAGNANHPARQNHRIIPLKVNGHKWGFQYSPYVYYNEHCIVFNSKHVPMKLSENTFYNLLDFVRQFPHYFLGSNADLPIVGGSILAHDHYQGGCYEFPMAKAKIEIPVSFVGYNEVSAGIVKWPMSVIRLKSKKYHRVAELAYKIFDCWKKYSDVEAYIYAETDDIPHNTITPIARMKDNMYEMDIVLRNNITTTEHPDGLYHPWDKYHNIKKENIGLIEVMGLAVLPARLLVEMDEVKKTIISKKKIADCDRIKKHSEWVESFIDKYDIITEDNIEAIIQREIGIVFKEILQCAGVYKCTKEGRKNFLKFIDYVNKTDEEEEK